VFCSAIPVDQHEAIQKRWGAPWIEVFGMTETGVNSGVPVSENYRFVGTGCIGRPLWHNEAAVLDENDRELPAGRVGELAFKGLGFMNGYYNHPEATGEFFRNGWAHTGDLVERDAEGYLYYRGRRKEIIRRGGENIAPVEIESALGAHPDVVECAVAPVPDADLDEEIKAYVVRHPNSTLGAEELADYLEKRLARFKIPRFWEFRSSLPHTASERVAKPELERGRENHLTDSVDLRTKRDE
jgi:crotonobetaine/carnitine-CoA ligase